MQHGRYGEVRIVQSVSPISPKASSEGIFKALIMNIIHGTEEANLFYQHSQNTRYVLHFLSPQHQKRIDQRLE